MLPLILSIIAILSQARWLRFSHVLEGTEEIRSTGVQILRFAELLEGEAAEEEIVGFAEELHAYFQVVQEVYVPLVIGTVDERNSRADPEWQQSRTTKRVLLGGSGETRCSWRISLLICPFSWKSTGQIVSRIPE
jgi:hypothetical protein